MKIYKEIYAVFGRGKGIFKVIPQNTKEHSCVWCALIHSTLCGKYACKCEEREDNQNVYFSKL